MKQNPKKCIEMVVNLMKNPNIVMRPLCADNCQIERVSLYKLLGAVISEELKWNHHIDYLVAKASKRLYALRLLTRAVRTHQTCCL